MLGFLIYFGTFILLWNLSLGTTGLILLSWSCTLESLKQNKIVTQRGRFSLKLRSLLFDQEGTSEEISEGE